MYIYKEKNTLLHKIHPISLIMYVLSISIFSLIFSHPFYLLGLLASLVLVILAADILKEWLAYLKISMGFIIVLMIVNAVIVQLGSTVLLWGPHLPGLGRIRITLEALCYGLTMGIRFLIIMSAFCLLTYVLHPDRGLKLIGSLGNKSVLALTISTRLFPLMISDFRRIYEVQRCRGTSFEGSIFTKIKNYFPIINAMLLSSLERSFHLAEALQARGYGVGHRTSYNQEFFRPRDYIIIFALAIALLLGLWLVLRGETSFIFYPRLQVIKPQEVMSAMLYSMLFIFPALLDWGWQKWPLLKSKI